MSEPTTVTGPWTYAGPLPLPPAPGVLRLCAFLEVSGLVTPRGWDFGVLPKWPIEILAALLMHPARRNLPSPGRLTTLGPRTRFQT